MANREVVSRPRILRKVGQTRLVFSISGVAIRPSVRAVGLSILAYTLARLPVRFQTCGALCRLGR